MAALGLLRAGFHLTDSFFVGRLGPEALAAVGGSAFGWWVITLACDLPAVGVHARVARHEGAGRRDLMSVTLGQGVFVGAVLSVLIALAHPLRGLYFSLLGFAPDSAEHALGSEYLGVSMLGASTFALYAIIGAAFRGLGQTRTALVVTALALVVNAVLDPLLIHGLGPIPKLGVAGAALATAIANAVGAAIALVLLRAREVRVTLKRSDPREIAAIVKIGFPVTASGVGFAICYVALGRVITGFGPEQMGALGVGHRLEGLAYLVCLAFGVGAATMVGQHLGAGSADRARESASAAARTCILAMIPLSVLLFVFARPLFGVFTDDPATIEGGVLYLRIQVAVLVFMALEEVYLGAFAGAGDTLAASIITFSLTAARIPAAWWLAYDAGLGIGGVWLAIAASTALKGALLWLWWRRGRWRSVALEPAARAA